MYEEELEQRPGTGLQRLLERNGRKTELASGILFRGRLLHTSQEEVLPLFLRLCSEEGKGDGFAARQPSGWTGSTKAAWSAGTGAPCALAFLFLPQRLRI